MQPGMPIYESLRVIQAVGRVSTASVSGLVVGNAGIAPFGAALAFATDHFSLAAHQGKRVPRMQIQTVNSVCIELNVYAIRLSFTCSSSDVPGLMVVTDNSRLRDRTVETGGVSHLGAPWALEAAKLTR